MELSQNIDPLDAMNDCRRDIERVLRFIASPRKSGNRRLKPGPKLDLKRTEFKRKMVAIKKKLSITLKVLFDKYHDAGVYDKLAYDLMKVFHQVKDNYIIDKDDLYFAVRCITIAVIMEILEDERVGKKFHDLQQTRKSFIWKLLTVKSDILNLSVSNSLGRNASVDDSFVDVTSTSSIHASATESGYQVNDDDLINGPNPFTLEILDALVDALGKQSAAVNHDRFNIRLQIHHVINITYITEIVQEYLDSIKTQVETDQMSGRDTSVNVKLLHDALEKYERDLLRQIDWFSPECSMTIFRDQLDILLFRIISLKPLLRKT